MKTFRYSTLLSALAPLTVLAGGAHAQEAAQGQAQLQPTALQAALETTQGAALPTVAVWGGGSAASKAGNWGNGAVEASNGRGGAGLRVTVRNFHEGARFDLAQPLDLLPYSQSGFWRLRVQPEAAQRGGRGGRGGRTRGGAAATPQVAPLTQLRLKLVLENGALSAIVPLQESRRGGSQTLLLPLRSMSASAGASGRLQRIVLTGNSEGSLAVEQIELAAETSSITAAVRRAEDAPGTDIKDITVKPGRSTALLADVNAGTSDVIVTWNFDADNTGAYPLPAARGAGRGERGGGRGGRGSSAASSAPVAPMGAAMAAPAGRAGQAPGAMAMRPRVDAIGAEARPNWPNEEQDYRVEVNILDRTGRKAPVKKSILVKVRG